MKYLLSMYVCFSSLLGYVGVDGLFMGCCLHLSSHYKIIGQRIAQLREHFVQGGSLKGSPEENKAVQGTLVEIVNRHVEVLDLTKKVSKAFSYIVFIHFFAAAIVIGMTSINFLLVSGSGAVGSVEVSWGTVSGELGSQVPLHQLHVWLLPARLPVRCHWGVPARLGECHLDPGVDVDPSTNSGGCSFQTMEIMNSAYQFQWYKCNASVQKSLLLIIRRSQSYTGIEAPFFETNLSTFTSVSGWVLMGDPTATHLFILSDCEDCGFLHHLDERPAPLMQVFSLSYRHKNNYWMGSHQKNI